MNVACRAVRNDLYPEIVTELNELLHALRVIAVPLVGAVLFNGIVPFLVYLYHVNAVLCIRFQ